MKVNMQTLETTEQPIAYSKFLIISSEQVNCQSAISIWQPRENVDGTWGCEICLDGLLPNQTIIGNDSLQALCLAIGFAFGYLKSRVADSRDLLIAPKDSQGDSLVDRQVESVEYLEALFGTKSLRLCSAHTCPNSYYRQNSDNG
jgi:hypothetical protein